MYMTDARHFLDDKGAIGPKAGPGRSLADFLGSIIVAATLPVSAAKRPRCFKCAGAVKAVAGATGAIEWQCSTCAEEGRITNWQNTLWDMTTQSEPRAKH